MKIKIILGLTIFLLSACSVWPTEKNTALSQLSFAKQENVFKVEWQKSVSIEAKEGKTNLSFAAVDGQVFTLSAKGEVEIIDVYAGKHKASHQFSSKMQAGPYVQQHLFILVTQTGKVRAYDKDTWRQLWEYPVNSEIFAPIVIDDEKVLIKTIDGKFYVLDTATGQQEWFYEQVMPSLVLRKDAAPMVADDKVFVGFANAHVLAFKRDIGALLWEQMAARSEGNSPLSRMVDIAANFVMNDDALFVATYQGRLSALQIDTGKILWSKPFSSYSGMALANGVLYANDENGTLWAFNSQNGEIRWQQTALSKRHLSVPLLIQNVILVGDDHGNIYAFSAQDGHLMQYQKIKNDDFSYFAKVMDNYALFLGKNGTLVALSL